LKNSLLNSLLAGNLASETGSPKTGSSARESATLYHKQRAAEAAYNQAEAQYRSTVITAFQNVADTLRAIQADARAMTAFGRARNTIDEKTEARLVAELMAIPGLIAQALKCESAVEILAREIAKVRDVLYLGRGTSYPLALEGALKLKEISYIHAEGYAAGELKHGPIALVDQDMPVIVIAPSARKNDLEHAGSRRSRRQANPD
jgi:SIS domain